MKSSVISLISYDAGYLLKSIPRYYKYVDEIVLGLDKDRLTWNKNPFTFDEDKVFEGLSTLDVDNKISIVEEDFHQLDDPMSNDNAERNLLKHECSNDLIYSFDADEILLNAKEFFLDFMPIVEPYLDKNDVCMNWATPYKVIDDQVLLISETDGSPFLQENQGVVTMKSSNYVYARWTDKSASGANRIKSPLIALHWSIARKYSALAFKLSNTGHADTFKNNPMLDIWDSINLDNYHTVSNFKTTNLGPLQWPRLNKVPMAELEDFILSHKAEIY